MAVTDAPPVELATTPRSAADYPNIRLVDSTVAQPADIPRPTLAMMVFLIETIRRVERWLLDNAGLVPGPLHSSIGQEAVAAGTALALSPVDRLTSTHRAHHDVLARLLVHAAPAGWDPSAAGDAPAEVVTAVRRTMAEILGLAEGLCGGRGGSMHLADPAAGVATSAIVAGGVPAAAGGALAAKLRGDGGVAVAVVRRWRAGDRSVPRVARARPRLEPPARHPGPEQPLLGRHDAGGDRGLRGARDPRGGLRHAGPGRRWDGPAGGPGRDASRQGPRGHVGAGARGGADVPLLPPERAAPGQRVQVPHARGGAGVGGARSGGGLPPAPRRDGGAQGLRGGADPGARGRGGREVRGGAGRADGRRCSDPG